MPTGTILQGLLDSTPLYNEIYLWRTATKGQTTRLDPVLDQIMPLRGGRRRPMVEVSDYTWNSWRTGIFMSDKEKFLSDISESINRAKTS